MVHEDPDMLKHGDLTGRIIGLLRGLPLEKKSADRNKHRTFTSGKRLPIAG